MNQMFQGWEAVAEQLRQQAEAQEQLALKKGEDATRLNQGQRASLRAIAARILTNGVVIADEVGMGKTRIAVEVARCVIDNGGRVAMLVPPGLGYQWHAELRDGEVDDLPPILRSLSAYLAAWADNQEPWFAKQAVMVSHAFTNWRLGGANAAVWRWALVPEFYARCREMTDGRLPRGYHGNDMLARGGNCSDVAKSIFAALPTNRKHPIRRLLEKLVDIQWPRPLDPTEYSNDGELRRWLERSVGIGLGVFDLVITDEAHKSRGIESGLSRLLESVIVSSDTARRLALTATPVELDVSQWRSTLSRLGLDATALARVQEATSRYADAVKRVRQAWRSSPEARADYKIAAARFQETLSPYLLRRDKREDPEVLRFHRHSTLPINAYRKETEISVNTVDLSTAWRKAICAAESLSVVTRQSGDPVAKRLRLTLGNGHGIAALLDQIKRVEDDHRQEQFDWANAAIEPKEETASAGDIKRQERAEWWLNAISQAFDQGDESLFDHPAIKKAVETIEEETQRSEKVLVFGRFTRPLRALVDLLNAREMLRRVHNEEPWPQAKVHGDQDGDGENSEWLAVRAAHRQLMSPLRLETLDETLRIRYDRERQRREDFRERLIPEIERGWQEHNAGAHFRAIFDAFRRSVDAKTPGERAEQSSLALVARATMELLENPDAETSEYASTFCQLIEAVCDSDDADDDDYEIDADEATKLWGQIEGRLRDEYTRTQGGFARLMYGGTSPESRRMIQLAFNRAKSFPRVLVAQSLVGREGLNLHKSCRIVVLLHPEWNPGVVEQQIGRVDRVGSRWCNELKKALDSETPADQLPRIEVRPVIFRGTYDEHNWKVLRERWDNLRAQLHGDIISPEFANVSHEDQELFDEISSAAPNFSPNRRNT
jgi:Helicase conserved C-terminal domain